MFQNVIVRRPCRALVEGITSNPQLGKPDYEKACRQHDTYIEALKQCGVAVTVLEADERTFKRLGCNLTCEARYAG